MRSHTSDPEWRKLRSTLSVTLVILAFGALAPVRAQSVRYGSPVSPVVKDLYARGLEYLAGSQSANGSWGRDAGKTAICLMAMIASGEDPNFGRYAPAIRRATRYIIRLQDAKTGFIRTGMYQHGFSTLALGDVYGAIDEDLLWEGETPVRTVGQALELAVRCALTSQEQNPFGAWHYSPTAQSADTSVSGAVYMGLLAARNAGIEVPDTAIQKANQYYVNMTLQNGSVNYTGIGGLGNSLSRSSIATLVYAISKRKDLESYEATIGYLRDNLESDTTLHPFYFRYYMAQALFQGDYEAWQQWTKDNASHLVDLQGSDGSLGQSASDGPYATGMLLLSTALDYCLLPIYER